MFKEYKTITEAVGPLMVVNGVEGVTYNELVDIIGAGGEIRRGKVLEVNRDKAVVQLFESSQGLKISDFWGTANSLPFPATCWDACSTAWGIPATAASPSFPKRQWISTASLSTPPRAIIPTNLFRRVSLRSTD